MRLLIVTHVQHHFDGQKYFGYGPYVREMNLWARQVSNVEIVAPISNQEVSPIEKAYATSCSVKKIPSFTITSIKNCIISVLVIPRILITIYKAMKRADHIHLRCPGNIGLLGVVVQMFFPNKIKTAKYAGNWDPKAKQPLSYRLQKWLLKNELLTKNMKVLVYGDWKDKSKNIVPFFTASYFENEKIEVLSKALDDTIKILFVGTLSPGKQPLLTVKMVKELTDSGFNIHLDIYGEGQQRSIIEDYIYKNNISKHVTLHGNKDKSTLKKAYQKAHFLVFISKSEGWPKAIAEAMFWKCLPISTKVSCVPEMLNHGERGSIVDPKIEAIIDEFSFYLNNKGVYTEKVEKAYLWSRTYTLDRFEAEITKLLKH